MASPFASLWIRGLWQLFHYEKNEKKKKMKKWSSQGTQFMQLRKEAWKKFRTSTGFETVVQFWVESIVFILPVSAKHWTGFPRSQFRPHPYLLSLKPQWWADQVPWTALSTHQAFLQCLSSVCSKELLLACKTIHNINKNIQGNLVFKYSLQK